jgi:multicomponent Na+:H+ antiporter subunit C
MKIYFLCFILFCVGLYGVLRKRSLVKIIIGLAIMSYSVNLFFVMLGYCKNARSPIDPASQELIKTVDPIPQAIALTSIMIGLGVTLLLAAIAGKLYKKYGTFDITKIRKLRG